MNKKKWKKNRLEFKQDLRIAMKKNSPKRDAIFFQELINTGAEDAIVRQISNTIKKKIIKLKGKKKVVFHSSPADSKVLLTSFVEKLDTLYMVTIRVTTRMNRKTIFASSWEFKSEKEIDSMCKKIARDISGRIS